VLRMRELENLKHKGVLANKCLRDRWFLLEEIPTRRHGGVGTLIWFDGQAKSGSSVDASMQMISRIYCRTRMCSR